MESPAFISVRCLFGDHIYRAFSRCAQGVRKTSTKSFVFPGALQFSFFFPLSSFLYFFLYFFILFFILGLTAFLRYITSL